MNERGFGTRALGPVRGALRRGAVAARSRNRLVSSALRRVSQIGGGAGIDVALGNARVRLYPNENVTDKRAYLGRPILGEGVRDLVRRLAREADGTFRFVDVGGNSGLYSIRFAQVAREESVSFAGLAIEAFPPTFERMWFNLEASGLLGNVRTVATAVSDRNGTVTLDTEFRDLGRVRVAADGVEVPSRLLADLVAEAGMERIDLLKIDVEGHELAALAPFFEATAPAVWPRVVLAELLDDADPLEPLLRGHGYSITTRSKANAVFERNAV